MRGIDAAPIELRAVAEVEGDVNCDNFFCEGGSRARCRATENHATGRGGTGLLPIRAGADAGH